MVRRRFLSLLGALSGAALLAGCAADALNAVTSGRGFRRLKGLRYAPGARGTFDLYVPDGLSADAPLVVFVYGGSWDSGSKDIYYFVGQSLASAGFLVAIPDYRVYPETVFPGFVEDAAAATAAVVRLSRSGGEGVSAGRRPLILVGHSAGAEIAALLALDDRYLARAGLGARDVAGFVGLAGPYDFLPLKEERYKRIFPESVRADSQPINFAGGRMPPMLLVHGLADTTVDPQNTRSLAAKVRSAGGSAEVLLVPGLDHVGAVSSLATALRLGDGRVRESVVRFVRARA
ncbi:alpha/beta hydrolase [Antarcticirhabdus aurantiaca]|uniref:Alpha/beta hydrolase n=1 Tax=Antarcticirhabdus aurantiaca TaxID=2606717 RepID=A0ACD4NTV1_9HYPH|nr:alpha/beta hydrolase [Antarcticirhabdus aurantiaca]WAJ30242.1 alpha/beta hydrolase [Jeongeuplla avenae]